MDKRNSLRCYQFLPPSPLAVSDYDNPVIAWLEIKSGIQKVIANIQRSKIEVYSQSSTTVVGRNLKWARQTYSIIKLFTGLLVLMGIVGTVYSYLNNDGDFQNNIFNISLPLIITFAAVVGYLVLEQQQNLKPPILTK